jgi:hypothetical protein
MERGQQLLHLLGTQFRGLRVPTGRLAEAAGLTRQATLRSLRLLESLERVTGEKRSLMVAVKNGPFADRGAQRQAKTHMWALNTDPKVVAKARQFRTNFRNTLVHAIKQAPYCDISPSYKTTLRGMVAMLEAEMRVKGDKL